MPACCLLIFYSLCQGKKLLTEKSTYESFAEEQVKFLVRVKLDMPITDNMRVKLNMLITDNMRVKLDMLITDNVVKVTGCGSVCAVIASSFRVKSALVFNERERSVDTRG